MTKTVQQQLEYHLDMINHWKYFNLFPSNISPLEKQEKLKKEYIQYHQSEFDRLLGEVEQQKKVCVLLELARRH